MSACSSVWTVMRPAPPLLVLPEEMLFLGAAAVAGPARRDSLLALTASRPAGEGLAGIMPSRCRVFCRACRAPPEGSTTRGGAFDLREAEERQGSLSDGRLLRCLVSMPMKQIRQGMRGGRVPC